MQSGGGGGGASLLPESSHGRSIVHSFAPVIANPNKASAILFRPPVPCPQRAGGRPLPVTSAARVRQVRTLPQCGVGALPDVRDRRRPGTRSAAPRHARSPALDVVERWAALGPQDHVLGPRDDGLGPPEEVLGPPEDVLGPSDEVPRASDEQLRPRDEVLGRSDEAGDGRPSGARTLRWTGNVGREAGSVAREAGSVVPDARLRAPCAREHRTRSWARAPSRRERRTRSRDRAPSRRERRTRSRDGDPTAGSVGRGAGAVDPTQWQRARRVWERRKRPWERRTRSWEEGPRLGERGLGSWEHGPGSWERGPGSWEHDPGSWEHDPTGSGRAPSDCDRAPSLPERRLRSWERRPRSSGRRPTRGDRRTGSRERARSGGYGEPGGSAVCSHVPRGSPQSWEHATRSGEHATRAPGHRAGSWESRRGVSSSRRGVPPSGCRGARLGGSLELPALRSSGYPRRHPMPKPRLDPEDILAGRVKVTAGELLDLIHRVNPTGRDLPAREEALRYAQKSRLQSLLVRRFGPELTIEPDLAHEGTVSIAHRGQGRDGCHAVLDALDEDARSWVRRALDLGPPSSVSPPPAAITVPPPSELSPPSAEATPDSLVRRADRAIDSYDYERARAKLAQAVEASSGARGPAEALLDAAGGDARRRRGGAGAGGFALARGARRSRRARAPGPGGGAVAAGGEGAPAPGRRQPEEGGRDVRFPLRRGARARRRRGGRRLPGVAAEGGIRPTRRWWA